MSGMTAPSWSNLLRLRIRQARRERLDGRALQPRQPRVDRVLARTRVVRIELALVQLLRDAEPLAEHESKVVQRAAPRLELLLVEALGVDRRRDDADRVQVAGREAAADEPVVLRARVLVVAVRGRVETPDRLVAVLDQHPELGAEPVQDLPLLPADPHAVAAVAKWRDRPAEPHRQPSHVMPYSEEALAYASGPSAPARSASASVRKKPSSSCSRSWTCSGVSTSGGTSSNRLKAPPVDAPEALTRIVAFPTASRSPASCSSAKGEGPAIRRE